MKPYIMSYSEEIEISKNSMMVSGDTTVQTNTLESSDPDSLCFMDETTITKSLETQDHDQLYLDTTLMTETVEHSDPDSYDFQL